MQNSVRSINFTFHRTLLAFFRFFFFSLLAHDAPLRTIKIKGVRCCSHHKNERRSLTLYMNTKSAMTWQILGGFDLKLTFFG